MQEAMKLLSGGAMRPLVAGLVPLFERMHRVTLHFEFRLTSALQQAIQGGEMFDLAILPRPELEDLIARGHIGAGSAADVARSRVGLAVKAGAPRPDIGSVDALRRAILEARSIGYSDGPSGAYVAGLLAKLGIAEEVAAKTKLTSGPVAELVARGEAEIGMQQIVAILPVQGAELVGPLPAELQNVITYAAGISTRTQHRAAAERFIALTRAEAALALMYACGLEPP